MKNATLRQLRVFESAARHLSLTRAAGELHLSAPAVSIQVKNLEGHAGAALFERGGRRLRLTQEGEEVLLHVRDILGHIRGAEEAIAELDSLSRGLLDVAVINAGDHFFPWIVAAFRQMHPGIRVRLTVQNRDELLARLAACQTDLAVMSHPPTEPGHVATAFAPHPHVIAAAPSHPLARKRRIPLARIAAEPILTREPGAATRLAMDQVFAEAGVVPRIEMEIASNETIKQAAAAGLGVGFLSAHALRQELALGSLVILDVEGFPVMRQWYVVHRLDRRLPRIAQAFERFVLENGERLIGRPVVKPGRAGKGR
ncbi:MAG TPA: LysR family transcriptional regulator [Usitatibacteraceae bacterium]|nr:LysR family transcriptional regulator [Usitatibacteraceae bacterium]